MHFFNLVGASVCSTTLHYSLVTEDVERKISANYAGINETPVTKNHHTSDSVTNNTTQGELRRLLGCDRCNPAQSICK
jgi:hypothetical protein